MIYPFSGWRPGDPIPPRNKKAVLYAALVLLAFIAVMGARMAIIHA